MDFLNQATLLAILGYFGFLFKDIPNQILSVFIPKFVTTIMVDNQVFMAYRGFSDWLVEHDKSKVLSRHLKTDGWADEFTNTLGEGTYWVRFAPCTFVHIVVVTNINSNGGGFNGAVYKITATIYGKNQKEFTHSWNKRMELLFPTTDLLNLRTNTAGSISFSHCPKKSFDDVFVDFKDEIRMIIDKFISNHKLYKAHGVYYKIGFLFYGPPGSGKSTIARAIASYLNWGVFIIDSNSVLDVDAIGANKVIVIEDIDCFISSRDCDNRDDKSINTINKNKTMSLDVLLNFLDGTTSPNQCIIVATTNYIDRVDSAVLRPGRFDYKFKIDYMDKAQAMKMCDRYEVDYSVLDDFEFPLSPAEIQNKIFLLKNKI